MMQKPTSIEFENHCLEVLTRTLLALNPQEGCALLLAKQIQLSHSANKRQWRIEVIWPCCNIWQPGIFSLCETTQKTNKDLIKELSKENRFAIDPREQLHAQRWARNRKLHVLGTAHSHPFGEPIPSATDCAWSFKNELMVIINSYGSIGAWWMENNQSRQPLEIACLSN